MSLYLSPTSASMSVSKGEGGHGWWNVGQLVTRQCGHVIWELAWVLIIVISCVKFPTAFNHRLTPEDYF